jgi:hypothetical protein
VRSASSNPEIHVRTSGSGAHPRTVHGLTRDDGTTVGTDCTPNAWRIRGLASMSDLRKHPRAARRFGAPLQDR